MSKQITLDPQVRAALDRSVFTSDSVQLPEQLDRALYMKVNKIIETAGGKWNRKRAAHLFGEDPKRVLGLAIEVGALDISQVDISVMKSDKMNAVVDQLFPTPPDIARKMIAAAEIEPGMCVLEPSVGTGVLVQAVIDSVDTEILGYEIDRRLCNLLDRKFPSYKLHTRCMDFLVASDFMGCYPRVVMNPPFVRGADILHIEHALKFLAPGGRLVAICANGPRQREAFELRANSSGGYWEDLPAGTFKGSGTDVNTAMVVINRAKR